LLTQSRKGAKKDKNTFWFKPFAALRLCAFAWKSYDCMDDWIVLAPKRLKLRIAVHRQSNFKRIETGTTSSKLR